MTVELLKAGRRVAEIGALETTDARQIFGGIVVFRQVGSPAPSGDAGWLEIENVAVTIEGSNPPHRIHQILSVRHAGPGVLRVREGSGVTVRFPRGPAADAHLSEREERAVADIRVQLKAIRQVEIGED